MYRTLYADEEYKYDQIGFGTEGAIYKYDENTAFKTFFKNNRENNALKIEKVKTMTKLNDPSFAFPKGLIHIGIKNEIGYYMDLVHTNPNCKDFYLIDHHYLVKAKEFLDIIIKADEAIKRAHRLGIVLGDIKKDNILVDINDNPIFVDTDNYAYGDYSFDMRDKKTYWLKDLYGRSFDLKDNDKYVYTLMVLQYYLRGIVLRYMQDKDIYRWLIKLMVASPEVKEIIETILSDSDDKPYIGDALKLINPEEDLFQKDAAETLRRFI